MRYTYTNVLNTGDCDDVEVTVTYSVTFGCEARTYGPPEDCYPAEPDEIDDVRLVGYVGGLGISDDAVISWFESSYSDEMIEHARGEAADERVTAEEARWELAREDALQGITHY